MRFLIDFIQRYTHLLLFLVLEAVCGVLLFRHNAYQGSVVLSSANEMAARVGSLYGEAEAFVHLGDVNKRLTEQNLRLQTQNAALRAALQMATRDTTMTERLLRETLTDYELLPARVVCNTRERAGTFLVINRGSRDGVRQEMGVVGGGGVVGITYLVGPNYTLVLPVTNRKSAISCRLRGGNHFGHLGWQGGKRMRAYLDEIPRHAHVRIGDVVETSGYSNVFPPGLFVGRVSKVGNSADGQSYRLDVQLGTDFDLLHDVSVVLTPYRAEIDTLRARIEE